MPKKKPEFPEDLPRGKAGEKEEKYEEVWDLRKVVAGVIILLVLIASGVVGLRLYLHQSIAPSSFIPKFSAVKGENTGPTSAPITISLPSAQDVQQQIQNVQQQVTHLNVADIASTSPQVQDILKQIENIPAGPENQVKDACVRLCNNL